MAMAFYLKCTVVLATVYSCFNIVQCQTCTEGDIRLVDGANQYEGRVEICHNNVWGTVCDDAFDRRDSAVVCRQLGFAYAGASTPTRAHFGQGTGQIWLDDLRCTGSEARLTDCGSRPFGSHNCGHNEDVGTRCIPDFYCTDGDIRLVDGTNELEGRVEVCFNGTWGTVCDDFWSSQDANVACGQLGFSSTGAQARARAAFGQGIGDIFLDNVVCDGNELRLIDCASNPLAAHNCLHSEDAGAVCQPAPSPCTQGDIRLVAGARDSEGRVEVCNQNQWGSVCDVGWDLNDGNVACRQAGFGSASAVLPNAAYGEGTGRIWMSGLTCGTTQLSLFSCTSTTPLGSVETSTSCRHADDASVRCQGLATACTPAEQGNIRLANGSTPYEGRVEVCYNGQWGTVCDDGFGGNDAGVACRQLGFSPWAATAVDRAGYGQGTGLPIVLDDLACSSTESRLIDCRGRQGSHNCNHREDAGVICVPPYTPGPAVICVTGDVRLVRGSNPREGRLEICYYNQWGTICSSIMTPQVAQVACRQLGFAGSATPLVANTTFGQGDGPIVANVACNGTEDQLMDCLFNITHGCVHGSDMALRCTATGTGCSNGAIRLAGTGSSSTQGRVEVCNNNQWGTVCDDTWNSMDARVACLHLGYSNEGATGQRSATYGQGTGPILLDQVRCNGNESSIFDCPQNPIGQHDCSHFEDAGITCSAVCHDGDLRLVGGRYPAEGRLEFCYGGVWGTVCRDQWGAPDAQVACRQLGFIPFDATVILNATAAGFGVATGPILIDETRCIGNESSLISCRHNGIGTHNCPHSRDVGLRCVIPNCEVDGEVRLVGGSGPNEGRVEFCYQRIFGTVCGDGWWDTIDAQVVCRQFGYPIEGATALRVAAVFGPGTGRVWINRPQCTLNSTSLDNCTFGTPLGGTIGCGHNNDAGVICFSEFENCTEGDVRLVDGTNRYEGRVEICHNNIWGTVCQDFFGRPNSAVVCRQLGLGYAGASTPTRAHFGDGSGKPVWLDNIVCLGTENNLIDCRANPLGTSNCGHDKDVGTRCLPIYNCTDGEIRLVGGSNFLEGRVEVCINGTWGTVCDDLWGIEEANVACSQLGFSSTGAVARSGAAFGQGSGGIFLDNVVCDGFERRLVDCASNPPATSNCLHTRDAGVICQPIITPCTEQAVRFVAGPDISEGRLEVCYNNQWGTVCDNGFDTSDARSACRQAGYSGESFESEYFTGARFGGGSGPIWMSDLTCSGTETSLFSCTSNTPLGSVQNTTSCTHMNDVSVRCSGYSPVCTPAEQGNIRLVNGSTPYEGRVELCNAGQWGTVCDDFWDTNDAGVACRQLGFSPWASTPVVRGGYGQGTDPIWLDNLRCNGRQNRLVDCPRNALGTHNCVHSEDAGVICAPLFIPGPDVICVTGDVRLVGGSNPLEGRLEVCFFNQWGTICSGSWGQSEAGVICSQLGYARTGATPLVATDFFGRGDGPIVGNNVMCRGDEDQIIDCIFDRNHNCGHENDVAVRCMMTDSGCKDGAIRLAGNGMSSTQGRVEVCNNNQWGTVCDDTWNSLDASVACLHLGYSNEDASGQRGAAYGQGSGPILLDQVQCFGNESDIFDCPQNDVGMHNCVHDQDAGVTCTTRCHDGDLRLVGGRNATEGRLEFCYGGTWGTVCRDAWGIPDARVACRQLGFPSQGAVVILNASEAGFGVPTGPVLYDEANCIGNEERLANCRHNGIGTFNCDHSRDVGLRCQAEPPQLVISPSNHSLRYQDPLRMTCVASSGSQVSYGSDPTTIVWLDANGQVILPEDGQVTITERTGVIEGVFFVESVLDICSTSFRHYGQLSCNARRVVGEDTATFNVIAVDVVPAQLIVTPVNQTVDCNTGVSLACSAIGFPAPSINWWFNGSVLFNNASGNVNIYKNITQQNLTNSFLDVLSFGGDNIGYYVCSAENPLASPTSNPARVVIDLATSPPVLAPTITVVERTAADEAEVMFEPQSLGVFNVRYYIANDPSTPDLTQYVDSVRTGLQQPQATLSGLDTCTSYWVTITASYCGRSSTTEPQLLGIKDTTPYQLAVLLADATCSDWIKEDTDTKLRDMEMGLQAAGSSCGTNGLEIPCFIESSWMCSDDDDKKLTFQTQIVGDNSASANDLKKCIDDWIVSGSAAAQSFSVGGSNLMVPPPEVPQPSSLPFWIWIIVGVVAGLILCSLVIIICCVICCTTCLKNRDKSMKSFPTVVMSKKDEQLIKKGDDEVEDDRYSVAVVDNPIYDVDPDEKAGTVAYYKGQEGDEDQEELIKLDLGP